jgi:DNA-binding NarL/FixJ family response regulator
MTRVLIADDHPLVRDGLRHVLQSTSGFVVAGEANDGSSAIALVRSVHAHVIVLDLSMPGRAAVELIKQIKLDRPRLRMLVLATHAVQRDAMRSFRAGAAGYLTRECASAELVEAVTRVAAGGVYVSLSMPESVAESLAMRADAQG